MDHYPLTPGVMRKAILPVLLGLMCSSASQAQLAFGLEGGIGASSMYFAPAVGFTNASQTPITSWKVGEVADIQLNNNIFVQTGASLLQKGQSRKFSFYTSDSLNVAEDQDLKLLYAEIPINIVFKTGHLGTERFFFGIGANFGYLIGGKFKYHSYGSAYGVPFDTTATDRAQDKDPVRAFEMGLNLNGGYELPSGLLFRLYYTLGISDVGMGTEIDKNRNWGFSVGYLFGKRKALRHETQDLIDSSPIEDE